MDIDRYRKIFGVGPLSLAVNLFVLTCLWLLDKALGHLTIMEKPGPLRTAGVVLIACWICWHAWCVKTIRRWWNGNQLCTEGPFRLVRHPIYAGGLWFALLGVALMLNSRIVIFAPLLQYLVLSLLVRREESMMLSVFGERYAAYAARTGRLFPRWGREKSDRK